MFIAKLQGVDRVVLPFAFPFYGHPVQRNGTKRNFTTFQC